MKREMKDKTKKGKIELISPTVACAGAHCMLWVAGHLQREKSNETLSSVVVCHTNECFMWCIFILVWSISATTCCFPLWLKMIFWIAMMYPNLYCQWCICVCSIFVTLTMPLLVNGGEAILERRKLAPWEMLELFWSVMCYILIWHHINI